MYDYQYIVLLVLVVMLFSKTSNLGAFILLSEQLFYYLFVVDIAPFIYYSLCATINILVGILLQNKYLKSAICSYLLSFVNIYGYFLWYNYHSPISYGMLSAVIVVAQLMGIFPDGIYDRVHRAFNKLRLANRASFDNIKTCVKMFKNTPTKKQAK